MDDDMIPLPRTSTDSSSSFQDSITHSDLPGAASLLSADASSSALPSASTPNKSAIALFSGLDKLQDIEEPDVELLPAHSITDFRSGTAPEREARSRIAALSPSDVGEELLRIGFRSVLVSTFEESEINGADLLALTDSDLLAMGIVELYTRNLVLRTIAHVLMREPERLEQMTSASRRTGDDLPTYSR
ncbi:hypothetical protein HDU96_001161 [Phlyctochytrium bullatum]|nr:hypothetical protein HDU96_001161 [Phlyctochytrium bullatum]